MAEKGGRSTEAQDMEKRKKEKGFMISYGPSLSFMAMGMFGCVMILLHFTLIILDLIIINSKNCAIERMQI